MLTITAVSRTSKDVIDSVMVTTYTPPEPPVTGHETAVTIVQGNNSLISVCDTLTLSADTLIRMLTEVGESVHRAGVCKLVIANSHGGNVAAVDLVSRDLRVRLDMVVVACSWSGFGYPAGLFTHEEQVHGIHAGAIETSRWCRVITITAAKLTDQVDYSLFV